MFGRSLSQAMIGYTVCSSYRGHDITSGICFKILLPKKKRCGGSNIQNKISKIIMIAKAGIGVNGFSYTICSFVNVGDVSFKKIIRTSMSQNLAPSASH